MEYSNIQRSIDSDLLPMTEKQLTLEWAKLTYTNFHLFDKHVTSTSYSSNEDLQQWILKAKSLMKDSNAKTIVKKIFPLYKREFMYGDLLNGKRVNIE